MPLDESSESTLLRFTIDPKAYAFELWSADLISNYANIYVGEQGAYRLTALAAQSEAVGQGTLAASGRQVSGGICLALYTGFEVESGMPNIAYVFDDTAIGGLHAGVARLMG